MKNIKIAVFLFLLICLVSCVEKSDGSEESVIGTESLEAESSCEFSEEISEETTEAESFYESSEEITQEESEEIPSQETVSEEASFEYAEAEGFVLLAEAVPDAILEVRYYSTYNFVGARIDGYEEPCLLITKEAAAALKKVNDELLEKGYRLKIFDAYRPVIAVEHFVRWSKDLNDQKMKPYFYPETEKSLLFKKGFIAEKSGHSRGSTVDLTLFCDETGKEVDMGGTFDFFGVISRTNQTEGLTDEQIANRTLLRETMIKYGFKPANNEWWHFTLKNEPYPDTYFNFPVNSQVVESNN